MSPRATVKIETGRALLRTTIAGDRPPRYGYPGRLFRSFRSLMSIALEDVKRFKGL